MTQALGMDTRVKVERENVGKTASRGAESPKQLANVRHQCDGLGHSDCQSRCRHEPSTRDYSSSSPAVILMGLRTVSRLSFLMILSVLLVLGPQEVGASFVRKHTWGKNRVRRGDSPTDVCSRWSHQSAIVNGTLYIYGGRSTQHEGQADNTWNNDFLSLPLTESWDISSPKIQGLPQPSGPPPVANGYLWNSYDTLYLYGGEYSDTPEATPDPYALWEYDIKGAAWKKSDNPKTSAGNNSDGGNQPVQRSAEGAGISVPELGRGWYFGGHLDHYTTPGWSKSVSRLYLKSLIEYTFPGYSNDGVQSLSDGKTADEEGVWRNITTGGIQDSAAFPNRADGVLVYVPGFGNSGIILSLTGGNNESFVGHQCFL